MKMGPILSQGWLRGELASLASLAVARRAGPDRPWSTAADAEQRLLAAAGALAETVGASLVERIDEVAPPAEVDSGGAFARALVLGSVVAEHADAAADAATRTLALASGSARAACIDGLSLAPSPAIGGAVARLLSSATPVVATAALSILRFRRQVPYGALVPFLAHPAPEVAAAAARALGVAHEADAARRLLSHLLGKDGDEAVGLGAAEALLELGASAGIAFVRAKLEAESTAPVLRDEARVAYLRLLALGGDAGDCELFFRSVEPAAADAAAVGWFGHPDLVDWLLGSLEAANETRKARSIGAPSMFETSAARALARMLGAPGRDAGRTSDGDAPIVDAGRWRSHWHGVRSRVGSYKLRFGQAYDPLATVEELAAETLPSTRSEAALELAIASRGVAVVETGDWVARQRTALTTARAALAREPWPTGAFAGERLG